MRHSGASGFGWLFNVSHRNTLLFMEDIGRQPWSPIGHRLKQEREGAVLMIELLSIER